MDSASPIAWSVAGQQPSSESSVAKLQMGLRFETFPFERAETGFDGAGVPADWTWTRTHGTVPSRYRYRRSDRPRTTGDGPHA